MKITATQYSSLCSGLTGLEKGKHRARTSVSTDGKHLDAATLRSSLRQIQEETSYLHSLLDRLEEDAAPERSQAS